MHSVLIHFSTYARLNFSKIFNKTKKILRTYSNKRHLTVIVSSLRNPSQPDETPAPPKNGGTPLADIPDDTLNQHYHNHDVAHAAEVKYEKNRCIIPVNVKFGSTESDSTVNIASKHRKLFAAIKLLDPSAK